MKIVIIKITVILLLALLPASYVFADSPCTNFQIYPKDLAGSLLKEIKGAVRITGLWKRELKVYSDSNSESTSKLLSLSKTTPISIGGTCPGEENLEFYYYPVMTVDPPFINIVINPTTNERTWIRWDEKQNSYPVDYVNFGAIMDTSISCCVDIFFFNNFKDIDLYQNPNNEVSDVLKIGNLIPYEGKKLFKRNFIVLGHNGNYLQIGEYPLDNSGTKVLGWIKIRDKHGFLKVWPKKKTITGYLK
jgi:hypothetical protein